MARGRTGVEPRPVAERLLAKVRFGDGCWLWDGAKNNNGYGQIIIGSKRDGSHRAAYAHRLMYELCVGVIPPGLELDHVKLRGCAGPPCVNPWHLEPVTHAENMARGRFGSAASCAHGHPFSPENTNVTKRGGRHCKACNNERMRRYGRERREAEDRVGFLSTL